MKGKVLSLMVFCMSLIVGIVCSTSVVFAGGFDYTASPILPRSQEQDITSYFKLRLVPNQEETLQVRILNQSEKSQKFKVFVNTASTNQNGIIDYSLYDVEKESSMKYSIQNLIASDLPIVEVAANSEEIVSLKLKMPEEAFDGILLGGITIEPLQDESKPEQVNNIYTRTFAIQISENDKAIQPKLEAGEVSLSQINYHNVVNLLIRNTTPTIVTSVQADIKITKKGQKEPLLTEVKKNMSIAPNSQFNLPVEWQSLFSPGEYEYEVTLRNNQQDWIFKKEFSVRANEAKELNDLSIDQKSDVGIYIYLTIALIIVVIILISLYFIKKKR
ncbi:DUF916 and DUF3324 domain-containing protein [Carnobacterium maltaromaticum]|uniref:DUF916 and DUF3324 domain-containing protein n=1 Tax=Carnobacterium maltaromaticum TaxID=2751 RepID=UPI00165B5A75|nr:DUF916 and DUF3324 domain-containing protein [Carnobacterium maltaromaticum]MBC9810729.1 DUF3324 domain-containing protein [Carnobacterium maltaromaticum]